MIKRMEEQERKAQQVATPEEEEKKEQAQPKDKKWKQKFIKIWQYNDQLEQLGKTGTEENEQVGPRNFLPLMKLGQGSFG